MAEYITKGKNMAEYITKDKAKEVFINYMGATSVATGILAGCLYDKIPPSDVVEVIRCKDCKHRDEYGCCKKVRAFDCGFVATDDDDFCSYGERK